jgi:hypothetical protein
MGGGYGFGRVALHALVSVELERAQGISRQRAIEHSVL